MPAPTPTRSMPDVPPSGVWLVVGGPPPSDEAGCEGGGASGGRNAMREWWIVAICGGGVVRFVDVGDGRNAIPINSSKGRRRSLSETTNRIEVAPYESMVTSGCKPFLTLHKPQSRPFE